MRGRLVQAGDHLRRSPPSQRAVVPTSHVGQGKADRPVGVQYSCLNLVGSLLCTDPVPDDLNGDWVTGYVYAPDEVKFRLFLVRQRRGVARVREATVALALADVEHGTVERLRNR